MAFCSEEVFPWLKNLPLAPEYHPTLQEFQDPIAYIFKIEREASQYGICKIVPPLPPAPKKTVITNFNRSLAARLTENDHDSTPTFTTRQQQIGFCPRKPCPVKKPVWQSGERYTFHEFESKAKTFEKSCLKKCGKRVGSQHYSALEIETLYWKATVDKPFSVEYANDMPGSAFAPLKSNRKGVVVKEAGDVGESSWNMRGVSRAKGSLLKFMKEEIPGVTSPMVYLAMLFSWFAWHVEDHDLHSLNYLHMGAAKTWYGVPRDAAVAFEEVVRVHGYGGEVNPLVTFAVLGEKTTVISPEVLVNAGVPCCRLVQNAGEFVVTFPRAYHSGFSHGFNCGEASNIATPEWLRFAKDAAFRRASINYPPMVSHFQLLFDYTLAESSRAPATNSAGPRSSRLKEKKKDEGESMIKEQFVQNVIQDNDLLHKLGKGSSVVLLPESSLDVTVCANLRVGSRVRLDCPSQDIKSPKTPLPGGVISDQVSLMRAKIASLYEKKGISSLDGKNIFHSPASHALNIDHGGEYNTRGDLLSDQRLFSCVKCGILTFACTAIVQPREAAARYLMSADWNLFNDWTVKSGVPTNGYNASGSKEEGEVHGRYFPLGSAYRLQGAYLKNEMASNSENEEGTCALGLLALNYGNSSDSEEDQVEPDPPLSNEENALDTSLPQNHIHSDNQEEPSVVQDCHVDPKAEPLGICHQESGPRGTDNRAYQVKSSADLAIDDASSIKACNVEHKYKIRANISSRSSLVAPAAEEPILGKSFFQVKNKNEPYLPSCDEDSSRMHIFCLEHAIDVEERLQPIGGAHIYLLCHPVYPRVEAEARLLAKELQIDNFWNDIEFKDATEDDEDRIKSALDSEDAIPGIGDWAVKLGINLFYSANLSWSPLYTKQMPYNSVIYNAFGRNSPSSPVKLYDTGKRSVKQKKVVAGKWCGKIWMSNQVHPFLAQRDDDEQEEERSVHTSMVPNEVSHPKPRGRIEAAITKRKSSGKRKLSRKTAPSKKCKVYINEEVSDDSLTDGSHRAHEIAVRGRQGKNLKKEDTFSDDQSDENLLQHQSDNGSKQSESHDGEYSDFDPSVDGASHRPRCRISRRQPNEFTLTEDEVSDDSMDDNPQRQRMTLNVRGKLAKQTEEEDAISSGDSGETSHWRQKRTVKRKLSTPELEDDIPDSPLEGKNTSQPRIRRNKQLALSPLQRRTRETPQGLTPSNPQSGRRRVSQYVKPGNSRLNKQVPGNSRLTKQVTSSQLKQGTARLIHEKREPKPRQLDILVNDESGGLSSRLRKRTAKVSKEGKAELKGKKQAAKKNLRRSSVAKTLASRNDAKVRDEEAEYQCDIEGCTMGFSSKQELVLHKKNICPVKECGKKFFSHKYLVQHRRVHVDDRPLKCPWKGCKMAFKWAWARTEHIRVHTGARPYVCAEPGCGQTFRFVSDFSRHKRKTGHSIRGKG